MRDNVAQSLKPLFVMVMVFIGMPWLALLYAVVHVAPGLLGHRYFERNTEIGDLRVTRKDYSPLWFIAGNHRMTWELVRRGVLLAGRAEK